MLRKTDRAFLNQMVRFQHVNKAVSSIALYDAGAGKQLADTAAKVVHEVHAIPDENAWEAAQAQNMGSVVNGIIAAKLFAETANAVEDLGSLCFAVKHRKKHSIFKRYALCRNGGSLFSEIVAGADNITELTKVLGIPKLNKLQGSLDPKIYSEIENVHNTILRQLEVAGNYFKIKAVKSLELPEPADVVYVVYHTEDLDKQPPKAGTRSNLVKAYNKIKHGFLVFDDISELTKAFDEEDLRMDEIQITSFPRTQEHAENMLKISAGISNCMGLIAWIILTLDKNGIDI
ncbi:MAG: hypothetical protein P4N59_17735 [Negativicutes bacterium]|nr:hypothetical protein [Negativicutes bacterium]